MNRPFELEWLGGTAERLFRRRTGAAASFPWGTLGDVALPPGPLAFARRSWTEGAFAEYCSAAGFAELTRLLLAAGAPIDLSGAAAGFVAEELLHVELNARMAMELGGAAPCVADLEQTVEPPPPGRPPWLAACALAVRLSCAGEGVSAPLLAATARAAEHPLTRAVLRRIARDEGPHARLGWLVLDWAADRLDGRARRILAAAAGREVAKLRAKTDALAPTTEGWRAAGRVLGWLDAAETARIITTAIEQRVRAPLRERGIEA